MRRTSGLHHLEHAWIECIAYRTPSVAAKLRLVARFAALPVLVRVRNSYAISARRRRNGGAYRDRTDDLMLAKQPLSQLS